MITTGLVSISFRNHSCESIVKTVAECGLESIEWGGDVHVPAGDIKAAEYAAKLTAEAGLSVSAYGSYYKAGTYGTEYMKEFEKILSCARVLKAPVIRIWAGVTASDEISEDVRINITRECAEIAELAKKENIAVAFECHNFTLTDDYLSAIRLLNEAETDNLYMYWQPNERKNFEYNIKALKALMPYLLNVHVFNWPAPGVRMPLADGVDEWKQYLSLIKNDSRQHFCSLEFMPDDNLETLGKETDSLKRIIALI